jgi:hypothetical protein
MNAAFGFRFTFGFAAFFTAFFTAFFATFLAGFFAAFFLAAIENLLEWKVDDRVLRPDEHVRDLPRK